MHRGVCIGCSKAKKKQDQYKDLNTATDKYFTVKKFQLKYRINKKLYLNTVPQHRLFKINWRTVVEQSHRKIFYYPRITPHRLWKRRISLLVHASTEYHSPLYMFFIRNISDIKIRTANLGLLSTLRWRHNGRDDVSNHQPHDCLINRLFRRRSKKTAKLRVTGLWDRWIPRTYGQ